LIPNPNPAFWGDRVVLVTGGAGFIGSHLVEQLVRSGAKVRVADSFESGSRKNLETIHRKVQILRTDLCEQENCIKACSGVDVVMNLAASVAGVEYNSTHSSEMFIKNTRIGMNMLEAARLSEVDEFLCVSSACVYSRNATVPTPETEGFLDDPEASNLGYGWAKRVLEVQSKLYANQYGMKIAIVRPFNTYGPRDHFGAQYGHVIPSLVSRVMKGESPLRVWGNGKQTRSFVFVSDVIRGILLAVERYATADPINIGSSEEVSIGELARLVVAAARSSASIIFDESKPQGQPHRCPDVRKAKAVMGFETMVQLKDGLRETIDWVEKHRNP
jgi:GDP-L-fucose synthase